MIFFLFVTFFTVSGVHVSHTAQLEKLLSTETPSVKAILDMIEDLRGDNRDTITKVTGERDEAKDTNDRLQAILTDAIDAEELALGHVRDQKKTLNGLIVIEDEARTVEKTAKAIRRRDQTASDTAAAFRDSENDRIDEEKQTCEQIIVLLTKLSETAAQEFLETAQNNRRLLSVIDLSQLAEADPNSVKEVKEMINELITDGELERTRVIKAAEDALAVLKESIEAHEKTLNALYWASGDVVLARETLDELVAIGTKATAATATATLNAEKSSDILAAKTAAFDFESARVVSEEKVFVEVTELLNTLK